jgi:hypothetical protein
MSAPQLDSPVQQNQRELIEAIAEIRAHLEQHRSKQNDLSTPLPPVATTAAPAMLERLCATFRLSRFERAVLLMCAGMELDSSFASICAAAQSASGSAFPNFSLALAALPDAPWSALTPMAPLRRWRLVEFGNRKSQGLLTAPLEISERVLHFLTGIQYLDEELATLLEPVEAQEITPSQLGVAKQIANLWKSSGSPLPVAEICGPDAATRRAVAENACSDLSLKLYALPGEIIPAAAAELNSFLRIWERESVLSGSALYVETETVDQQDKRLVAQLSRLAESAGGVIILGGVTPWRKLRRASHSFDVGKPLAAEQRILWNRLADKAGMYANGSADLLTAQFNLTAPAIRASVEHAVAAPDDTAPHQRLWDGARTQARVRLDDLAERIQPSADWDDLVLPVDSKNIIRQLASQLSRRKLVYDTWGFGVKSSRGLGISALFSGPSGTGKTMAAEVLARTLRLDLYRIDLASMVSKYIGETEKNIRRVFDAAEEGGAILFFDEADALFGKRSEVKDSHDRYANIEISYLLQRMESYRGVAILATNLKSTLDTAFLRRIRFVVTFPFPDVAQRAEIWQKIFPPNTPTEGLDIAKLSKLNVAGGNIRNIALNAAFLAAGDEQPVRMRYVLEAARAEFAKLEKPLAESEIKDWQ